MYSDRLTVGIVGNGFVGNAIYQNVRDKVETKVYDVDPLRSLNTWEETTKQSIVFVCLPTPMKMDGTCDLSYLDEFFAKLDPYQSLESLDSDTYDDPLYVIKSTVPVGTTEKYAELGHTVCHNPEFLTARNAVKDFEEAPRTIIGARQHYSSKLGRFYNYYFSNTDVHYMTSNESETVKYFSNVFLAYKVAYFNKMYDFCEKHEMKYEDVRRGVVADPRIGESHTEVPGVDNDRGFGGTCFPKDLNALIAQFDEVELDSKMFKEIWKYNKKIRTKIDWNVT